MQNRMSIVHFFLSFNIKVLSNAFNLSHLLDFFINLSRSVILRDQNRKKAFLCYPCHQSVLYDLGFCCSNNIFLFLYENKMTIPTFLLGSIFPLIRKIKVALLIILELLLAKWWYLKNLSDTSKLLHNINTTLMSILNR